MHTTPGQLPAMLMVLVSALVGVVAAFAPSALSLSEKTAIIAAAAAAVPVGVYLVAYFRHQTAMLKASLAPRPSLTTPPSS